MSINKKTLINVCSYIWLLILFSDYLKMLIATILSLA